MFFSTGRPGITNARSVGGVDGIAVGVVGVDIELSRLMRRLHRRATIDELTGILNRAHLFERGTRAIADARRQRHPLAVAVFDLDGFKDLNDRNGHRAGDDALREVSARFAALCRADDHVGRLGGDEFALVLPRTGPLEAQQLAERLCAAIGATPLATSAGPVTLTASVGVASLGPTDASFDDVLAVADLRMLSAKSTDRRRGSLVRATDDAVMR